MWVISTGSGNMHSEAEANVQEAQAPIKSHDVFVRKQPRPPRIPSWLLWHSLELKSKKTKLWQTSITNVIRPKKLHMHKFAQDMHGMHAIKKRTNPPKIDAATANIIAI